MIKKVVFLILVLSFGVVMYPALGPEGDGPVGSVEEAVPVVCCAVCGKARTSKRGEGSLVFCGGCKQIQYCSRECQKKDWKQHKKICAQLNAAESCAYKAIYDAVLNDKPGTVKLAIKKLQSERGDLRKIFEVIDENGRTLLHVASVYGNTKIFSQLIKVAKYIGVDLDMKESSGMTPLFLASHQGHEGVVKCLLDAGASVNQAMQDGGTPLCFASYMGHEAVVRRLLDAGASVNQVTLDGATPLCMAAQQGHEGVVKRLLDAGANVNQIMQGGFTPLYNASVEGHKGVVECLVEARADINKTTEDGATAFSAAIQNGDRAIAAYLFENNTALVRPSS